jgi:hypothetical protein
MPCSRSLCSSQIAVFRVVAFSDFRAPKQSAIEMSLACDGSWPEANPPGPNENKKKIRNEQIGLMLAELIAGRERL